MTDLAPFPNVKAAVVALLTDLVEADTETPSDLVDRLPFARVTGRGGVESDVHTARSIVDVDVFAASEKDADDLAELVRQRFLSLPRVVPVAAGLVLLDRGETVTAPQIVPWSSSLNVRRSVGTYAVSMRRTGI